MTILFIALAYANNEIIKIDGSEILFHQHVFSQLFFPTLPAGIDFLGVISSSDNIV